MQFFFADHVLDLERRELKCGSQQIALEPQVFDLLAYLISDGDSDHAAFRSGAADIPAAK